MLKMKFDFDDRTDFAIRFQADSHFIRLLCKQFREAGESDTAEAMEKYLDIATARPWFSVIISDKATEFNEVTAIDEIFEDI